MTADVNASDHQEPGAPPPRRSRAGRVARALSGVLVLGLTGGVVALAVAAPPAGTDPVPASTVDVPAAATTLVCPGPLQLPDDTTSGDSAFDRVPVAPNESVSAFDTASSGTASLTPLDGAGVALDAGTWRLASPTAPVILRAEPLDGEPARVAGATSSIVTDGDLRGLSAASCAPPTADVWLVGGSTELQSTADLVVVNPGATAADVTVEVWGPSGRVELADGGRMLVAPGAQEVVVLPGVAAEQRRTVVHVAASGGQVSAYVQDSLLDGFTPRGTDLVAGGAAPATTQVVPGLSVPGTAVDAADAGALRLLAPGEEPATVSVRLLGPDGDVVLPGAEAVDLAPGEVTDLSLGGLAARPHPAALAPSAPVVAGGMVARTGDPGELDEQPRLERAWGPRHEPGKRPGRGPRRDRRDARARGRPHRRRRRCRADPDALDDPHPRADAGPATRPGRHRRAPGPGRDGDRAGLRRDRRGRGAGRRGTRRLHRDDRRAPAGHRGGRGRGAGAGRRRRRRRVVAGGVGVPAGRGLPVRRRAPHRRRRGDAGRGPRGAPARGRLTALQRAVLTAVQRAAPAGLSGRRAARRPRGP
ncbi:DUF5719 family protein [Cellulomonas endometrii]|uniref:DUF5719 family protein n=1 Tax=Cellulomonas endometrii TaxID=3036301 RepID=UPI0024AD469C|nr:DUF5719 family protein [Cellulomonas endometrii]